MLRIIICDDDFAFMEVLHQHLNKIFLKREIEIEIRKYKSGPEFLHDLKISPEFQILFLDIDMPEINGIDLAAQLKKLKVRPYLIFVSSVESMVYQSFRVNPFWFIRKRFLEIELPEAIDALLKEMRLHLDETVTLQANHKLYSIQPKSICYVECINKTLNIFFENKAKNFSIQYTLSALERILIPYGFIRVHKGFLVNYRYIFSINRTGIILDSGESIPVSKYRLQEIKQEYGRLLC